MTDEPQKSEEVALRRKTEFTPGEQWELYGRYPYLVAKLLFFVAIIAGLVWLLQLTSAVVVPLFFSLLIAYVLNPTVSQMEDKGFPRPAGILLILTGLIGFFTVFTIFLYPTIATQVEKIAERLPEALNVLEKRTLPWFGETFGIELPETVAGAMESYGEEIQNAIPAVADQVGTWVQNALTRAGSIVMSIFNLILIPIFTFYFLRDFNRGKNGLERFLPPYRREVLQDRLKRMDVAVGQWFRGQIQVSVILAGLYAVGLGFVYGITGHDIQSGIVIGLLTGFLNVIPYVGFAVGSILAFLVVLIEWTGWGALIGVIIAFGVIQTAESYYLTPRIVGDKVGLKPVTVIIVLLIGGNVAGLLGVLLAIPIAGAVKVMVPDLICWYERSSTYTGKYIRPASLGWVHREKVTGQDGSVSEVESVSEPDKPEPNLSEPDLREPELPEPEVLDQTPERAEEAIEDGDKVEDGAKGDEDEQGDEVEGAKTPTADEDAKS